MSNSNTASSITDITQSAIDVGSIDQTAQDAASRAVQTAQGVDTGLPAAKLESGRAFLVQVLIDDSGSMQGSEATVRKAITRLREELQSAMEESEEVLEVLITISFLNRGLLQPYCRVDECIELNDGNHVCDGGTPLYTRTNEILGTLMSKVAELKASARTAQTFSIFVTDGNATDVNETIGDDQVSPCNNAKSIITGMTKTKQHIVCGVSIGGGADSTFLELGISKKWILSPDNDEFAFNDAMRQVSRASRSASRGAGAFQTTADGGFR